MHLWDKFPFVRFLLLLIIGISFQQLFKITSEFFFWITLFLGVIYIIIFLVLQTSKKNYILKQILGTCALSFIFSFGATLAISFNRIPTNSFTFCRDIDFYVVRITWAVEQKENVQEVESEVSLVHSKGGWKKASGKILVSLPKGGSKVYYGDLLLIKGKPREVDVPLNPLQFNYKEYLHRKLIYAVHYVPKENFKVIGSGYKNYFYSLSFQLRDNCNSILKNALRDDNTYQLISALVLGIRSQLDNKIKQVYSNTGIIHVLAVSGMHVIIIFKVLTLSLGFLLRLPKGKFLFYPIVILILLVFAIITGLPPSVVRAVLMFGLIMLGNGLARYRNTYNSIAFSAFVLLCFNPNFIFDVGFQLSYLAVIGIVYLHPRLFSMLESDNRIWNKIWELTSVSIAAQLLTFPLGLLYFNQFPSSFILANLVVIPATNLLLYIGIAILGVFWFSPLDEFLSFLASKIVLFINYYIEKIESLPYSYIQGVFITSMEAFMLYSMIVSIFAFLHFKNYKWFLLTFILTFLFSTQRLYDKIGFFHKEQLVVYAFINKHVLGFISKGSATIVCDSLGEKENKMISSAISRHLFSIGVNRIKYVNFDKKSNIIYKEFKDGNHILTWKNQSLFLLSSIPKMPLKETIKLDYLILGNYKGSKNDLQQFLNRTVVSKVILSGSLKKYLEKSSEETLNALNLPYHKISKDGAFIAELE